MEKAPLIVVLSAYNEFPMVREAFRLGIHDYIMKSDINREYLIGLMRSVREKISLPSDGPVPNIMSGERSRRERLRMMSLGSLPPQDDILGGSWHLACFEIDDIKAISRRFGDDPPSSLTQPMLSLSSQIPEIASDCILACISFSRFILLIRGKNEEEQCKPLCNRIRKIWRDYLNITCTVAISPQGNAPSDFSERLRECGANVTFKYIFGPDGIYTNAEESLFSVREASRRTEEFHSLWSSIKSLSTDKLFTAQQSIFAAMYRDTLSKARNTALVIVYNIMAQMSDIGSDLWSLFNAEGGTNFYNKINALESIADIEHWLVNFIGRTIDYLEQIQITGKINISEKAKRFIAKNYSDCHLTLDTVAEHVRFSPKYFSFCFSRENGMSFTEYLTHLRINKAKRLILKSDMKIYMISEAVGFNSVEHFTRVFKKITGVSPRNYAGEI
jgi:AraC-like DNA-binding protein